MAGTDWGDLATWGDLETWWQIGDVVVEPGVRGVTRLTTPAGPGHRLTAPAAASHRLTAPSAATHRLTTGD